MISVLIECRTQDVASAVQLLSESPCIGDIVCFQSFGDGGPHKRLVIAREFLVRGPGQLPTVICMVDDVELEPERLVSDVPHAS